MKKKRFLQKAPIAAAVLGTMLLSSSCSTTGGSMGLGAAGGAAAGAGIGLMADPGEEGENRVRNVIIGSAIGGVLGAGAGFIGDRLVKDREKGSYEKGKAESKKETEGQIGNGIPGQPQLLPARTEAKWVPDQVRGSTFVPGHFEYMIIEGAKWQVSR